MLSYGLPLFVVYKTVDTLAGRTTIVSKAVAAIVTAMVGGSSGLAVWLSGQAKQTKQTEELVRLRNRITKLERRLLQRGEEP